MRGKSAPCTEGGIWAQFVNCQYCLAECCYHSRHLFFKGTSNFLHWQFIRHPKNPQFDSMGWTLRLLCGMLERKPDNAFPRRKGHLLNLQIKVHFQSFSAKARFSGVSASGKRILIFALKESQPIGLQQYPGKLFRFF